MNAKLNRMTWQLDREKILIFAVFAQFLFLLLQLIVGKFLGEDNSYIHIIVMALSALPMVCASVIWIKYFAKKVIFTYGILIIVLLFHYCIYIDNRNYLLTYIFKFFCICTPCFLNMAVMKDNEKLQNILSKISGIMTLMGFAYFLIDRFYQQIEDYSMSFSYYMLWPALYYMYKFFESYKVSRLFLSIIIACLMIMLGSRGAVISWILYCFFLFLFGSWKKKKEFGIKLLVSIGGISILLNTKNIAYQVYNLMTNYGMEIRSLRLLAMGKFLSHDSGRREIYSKSIQAISREPLCGYGVGSNIYILDGYSHNIFLDLFLHFGLIIGSIICILMFMLILISYKRATDKKMWFLFMCAGFVPMLVSGIYLEDAPFAIFIGYCVSQISQKGNEYEKNVTKALR